MNKCLCCGCLYSLTWGPHFCAKSLPKQPKEFEESIVQPDGSKIAKVDYHDRRAWLESVAPDVIGVPPPADRHKLAAVYRQRAQAKAEDALAAQTVSSATV